MYEDKRLIIDISTSENASCIVILEKKCKDINIEKYKSNISKIEYKIFNTKAKKYIN